MQTLLKSTQAYRLLKTEGQECGFSHAYLLALGDSKNLRLALKTFAKIFFDCDEPKTYEKQRIAELIDDENFTDCLFFPADGKKLTVEDAEKIQEESTLNPMEGEKKLFVLGDFAEANVQTQNKLLKLLEEPPENVYFLLGASVVFPVLPTVLSRTKKLEIQPFSPTEIEEVLLREYGDMQDRDFLSVCAVAGNGSVGDSEKMVEGGFYQELVENAFSLALTELSTLPQLIKKVGETKRQKELLTLLRLIYRDGLLLKTGKGKAIALFSERGRLKRVSEKYSFSALLYAQECISEAEKQVKFNAVFPHCLEICISKILNKE